jgi:hypothetical protein
MFSMSAEPSTQLDTRIADVSILMAAAARSLLVLFGSQTGTAEVVCLVLAVFCDLS